MYRCLSTVVLLFLPPQSWGWSPAAAPLDTPWTGDVDPKAPHPEYPRPQMVRPGTSWQSLNGIWECDYGNYSDLERRPATGSSLPHQILVPYPIESSLSGIRALAPNHTVYYRRSFEAGFWEGSCERRILHIEKSGWNTSVWVDGSLTECSNVGEYNPFSCVIPSSPQEILIGAWDATEENPNHWQLRGKQVRSAFTEPSGMMYTASSGIWDSVWTECVPGGKYINDVWIRPDVDQNAVQIDVEIAGADQLDDDIFVEIYDAAGNKITNASGLVSKGVRVAMPHDTKLWSPESPYLYNATVRLGSTDAIVSYFGMRKISRGQPTAGRSHVSIMLNNQPFYQTGTLDQGWFPDGLYAAATDEALVSDLKAMKAMGFNSIRKHMKADTRRWFYHADRLGFLVWQDIPAWSGNTGDAAVMLWPEVRRIWKGFRNSPALVQWEAFNEGWGEGDPGMVNATMALFRELEPPGAASSRLLDDASGGRGFGCAAGWVDPDKCPNHGQGDSRCMSVFWTGGCGNTSDVVDHHHYPEPVVPYDLAEIATSQGKPFLLGEYGGFSVDVKDHMWTSTGEFTCNQGTRDAAVDPLPLTSAFVQYAEIAGGLLAKGLAGQIFTQITDIECERNGLLTYDRKYQKADFAAVRAANLALLQNATKHGFHTAEAERR